MITCLAASIALVAAFSLNAQVPTAVVNGGTFDQHTGKPVVGVNVFVLGTLDGTLSDSAGHFRFTTTRRASYVIAARRIGYRSVQVTVPDSERNGVVLRLVEDVGTLPPVAVQAGRYTAANEMGATLTPLEIATIPGTAADINRAIQTLPGVQQLDEGTGLFVRGGDYTETRVYLDGGLLLNPAQLQNPAGTFVGTLDPFLLEGMAFTAGGFGARYGDALSAIAELHTRADPSASTAAVSLGLAAVGFDVGIAAPHSLGIRVVGNHNDLTPVLRLNGSPRQFSIPPRGDDATASIGWRYRTTGRLSLFATQQTSLTGALNSSPSVVDTFTTSTRETAVVARWSDIIHGYAPALIFSSSANARSDDYGSFRLDSPGRLSMITLSVSSAVLPGLVSNSGVEFGWERSGAVGTVPGSGSDQSATARTLLYNESRTGHRFAEFDELEWRPIEALRLTAGLRHDEASFAAQGTRDPRLSGSFRFGELLTTTVAFGRYHQLVDPLLQALRPDSSDTALPAMSARHKSIGVEFGNEALLARVEVYDKQYDDLAASNRDFVTIAGGTGSARGVDVFLKDASLWGANARIVYSYVHARRTDPSSGLLGPAPADVPHTLAVIATRPLADGVTIGATFRYAAGRPFTPVLSATRTAPSRVWIPTYAAPGSDRLPAYGRLDLSASWFRMVTPTTQAVVYLAASNLLDRANVFTRQYTADYASSYDVRSVFNRSVYFGTVLTFGKP